VDPAHHILGLRLNFYVAVVLTIAGGTWFYFTQRAPAARNDGNLTASGEP
jgi:hypothetical protein